MFRSDIYRLGQTCPYTREYIDYIDNSMHYITSVQLKTNAILNIRYLDLIWRIKSTRFTTQDCHNKPSWSSSFLFFSAHKNIVSEQHTEYPNTRTSQMQLPVIAMVLPWYCHGNQHALLIGTHFSLAGTLAAHKHVSCSIPHCYGNNTPFYRPTFKYQPFLGTSWGQEW